jgi:hypothetical protein
MNQVDELDAELYMKVWNYSGIESPKLSHYGKFNLVFWK